jgi:hypothetical protein
MKYAHTHNKRNDSKIPVAVLLCINPIRTITSIADIINSDIRSFMLID